MQRAIISVGKESSYSLRSRLSSFISAFSGAILNVLGIVRAIVFLFEKKLNTKHPLWTIGFVVLYLCSYVLVFTVFAKSVIRIINTER